MTRVGQNFSDTVQKKALPVISGHIRANNHIANVKGDPKVLSMKEIVACETALLLKQQNRLYIRDIANKFKKELATTTKLSKEARIKEAVSLRKHVCFKKLRNALESLKRCVVGRNKDDVEEAIAIVEALVVQLTQREV
ncbi:hypothetical protein GOBAR_AA15419 [Gossypium barbadense]|uniref:Uncharacterized protein n=1 Tax=Gossypium barbadense TaxID=3634 RepID=A0A2P5XPI3_GOSBA|nr:hypothetical protein GOBAR_AA15419 [Gossypium barbadense]